MTSLLVTQLERQCRLHPEKIAIREGRRSITYAEFHLEVRRRTVRLAELGVGSGDTVLVFVPPSIELYVLLLAIWWRGAVVVFADAWTTRTRLECVTTQVRPSLFVGIPEDAAAGSPDTGVTRCPTRDTVALETLARCRRGAASRGRFA